MNFLLVVFAGWARADLLFRRRNMPASITDTSSLFYGAFWHYIAAGTLFPFSTIIPRRTFPSETISPVTSTVELG
mgnify:FL=1